MPTISLMNFYDTMAGSYDDVTQADARRAGAETFVAALTDRFPSSSSALDVACGTGLFSLPLAERGLTTVGADLSAEMLTRARGASKQAGLAIRWEQVEMQALSEAMEETFDLIVCMGNSLPHVREDVELSATLDGFRERLTENGVLVIHVLNYDQILARQERIVGITRVAGREYIRFYDFLDTPTGGPSCVRFNLLEIDWNEKRAKHTMNSTLLRPYGCQELLAALTAHNFHDVKLYGGLDFAPYKPNESDSLVLIAQR
jgi:glycine/sarcosine N-methyltransferase